MSEPATASALRTLRLKRNEDRRLNAGHLWIFSNEVDAEQTPLPKFKAGEVVRVLAHNDRFMGLAYVNPQSLICARLLGSARPPDAAWFEERLRVALALRERLYAAPYYRWVFGESDGLPGLVIDRYGAVCVVQIGTAGMEALKGEIEQALTRVVECETLIFKNDSGARALEGLPSYVEAVRGRAEDLAWVVEDGLKFSVELPEGQKTGWFFDQAANRRALVKYLKPGARVLDVFSYVGAWGVRAAHAGASEVLCVDSSAAALERAARNAEHNGLTVQTRRGDAFETLEALAAEGRRFDVAIVDPPAFAKRKKDLPKALAAYKRLNQLAMQVLAEDALLVSCSCSYHVGADELLESIARAARQPARHLQVLEYGGQAPDHPLHPAIPETRYLKAYFCRVTGGLK